MSGDEPISCDRRLSAEKPRVALVGPRRGSHGGVSATVRTIADCELAERYCFVMVPTMRDGSRLQKLLQALGGIASLLVLTARRKVDLVHLHSSLGASFTRKYLALVFIRRVPVVFHMHGGAFAMEIKRPGLRGMLRRRALLWALERADGVIALTDAWAQQIAAVARVRRLYVVPNAPDIPERPFRRKPDNGQILYLGHLYRDKGIFELAEAFARLRRSRPGVRLVVGGEGQDESRLRHRIHELGLSEEDVLLPGWVESDAKLDLLEHATCLVLPSYHEGLPLVVLEAMTLGVPVIATRVGGVPEVVRDGVDGLLVEPRDSEALAHAIAYVLDDPLLAQRLTSAAHERAANEFSSAAMARRVDAIYREVLGPR